MELTGSVEMMPELATYLRECERAQAAVHLALELRLQQLVDSGVPKERIVIRSQWVEHGWAYSIHIRSDEETWLDWLSENH